jgi:hypothetical protein
MLKKQKKLTLLTQIQVCEEACRSSVVGMAFSDLILWLSLMSS